MTSSAISVASEQQRARRYHVAAGHERELRARHLVERRAADLPRRLDDEVDAVDVRLGEAPAARVAREAPAQLEPMVLDEGAGLARLAEAVLLERGEDEGREGVVELRHLHVPGPHARHAPEVARRIRARRLEER